MVHKKVIPSAASDILVRQAPRKNGLTNVKIGRKSWCDRACSNVLPYSNTDLFSSISTELVMKCATSKPKQIGTGDVFSFMPVFWQIAFGTRVAQCQAGSASSRSDQEPSFPRSGEAPLATNDVKGYCETHMRRNIADTNWRKGEAGKYSVTL